LVDGASIEERVYVAEEAVREVEVEGVKVRVPELVVGASTMEAWGRAGP